MGSNLRRHAVEWGGNATVQQLPQLQWPDCFVLAWCSPGSTGQQGCLKAGFGVYHADTGADDESGLSERKTVSPRTTGDHRPTIHARGGSTCANGIVTTAAHSAGVSCPHGLGCSVVGVCFMLPDAGWQGTVGMQQRPDLAVCENLARSTALGRHRGPQCWTAALGRPGPV